MTTCKCKIPQCNKKIFCKGLCKYHYSVQYRGYDPYTYIPYKFDESKFIGKRYGHITILKFIEPVYSNFKGSRKINRRVIGACECGKEKNYWLNNLKSGLTKSCGCRLRKDHNPYLHTRLHNIWMGMKSRCTNKNLNSYKYYGARGIGVCREWQNDFSLFRKWALNNGYKPSLSIDRIDPNGDYEPRNCRWATFKQQANNTRINYLLTSAQLAKKTGYSRERIRQLAGVSKSNGTTDLLVPYIKEKQGNRIIFKKEAIAFLKRKRKIAG